MNTPEYTVGNYLVDRLKQLGLRHLFSIAGDYSIEWVQDCVRRHGIEVIPEVSELCAGYAADGYARLQGIGALCVTYSAGSLSATNAIAGAYTERVPIVLINGTPSIKRTLTYEQTGFSSHHFIAGRQTNLEVFRPITSACERLDDAQEAPSQIDGALLKCITKRSPVYLELLQDVAKLPCRPCPREHLIASKSDSDPDSLEKSVALIRQSLLAAEKPLIWLGVEIDRFGLRKKAEELLTHLKIPFVTQLLSKAVLSEDHELFAGVFDGQASDPAVQALASASDFILALGIWLTDINTLGWTPVDHRPDFDKTAFVSFDTVKFGSVKFGSYFGAQVALEDLIDRLLATEIPCMRQEYPRPVPATFGGKREDKITYQGFYDFLSAKEFIKDHMIVGSDPSLNYFGTMLLKVGAQRGYVAQSSYSSIGYIAPAATGLSLARKERQRVVVFTGDGGFQMSMQCVSTQTRFKLNPIIFVIDNGVFGVEQFLHDASQLSPENPDPEFSKECLVHRWNYHELARVFTWRNLKCLAWNVATYGELEEAIEQALANKSGPSLIQVRVPEVCDLRNIQWKIAIDQAARAKAAGKPAAAAKPAAAPEQTAPPQNPPA